MNGKNESHGRIKGSNLITQQIATINKGEKKKIKLSKQPGKNYWNQRNLPTIVVDTNVLNFIIKGHGSLLD